jgi:hypothetical protein
MAASAAIAPKITTVIFAAMRNCFETNNAGTATTLIIVPTIIMKSSSVNKTGSEFVGMPDSVIQKFTWQVMGK